MTHPLDDLLSLPGAHDTGQRPGITSVCSAHPMVIQAALAEAADTGAVPLIESTCNQVNQDGGYTGMTSAAFHTFVLNVAGRMSYPSERILFGGDHLGPNPWRKLPAAAAMDKALTMTAAYAAAGFAKIHLDASMSCADDPATLPPATIADRAAQLARAAEDAARAAGHPAPAYVIGTEVPVPGGAAEVIDHLTVTSPTSAAETRALHKTAFTRSGLHAAFDRAIGLVVQPGVEFGHANVIPYQPNLATDLTNWRDTTGGIVFEAHSTDYQTPAALAGLVRGGFAILKVGPGLTFALREAFYSLDLIAGHLIEDYTGGALPAAMETLMQNDPAHWQPYCHGSAHAQYLQRHFSYSDRIRYYWTTPAATQAVKHLFQSLANFAIPETLISQYLPRQYDAVLAGYVSVQAHDLAIAAVRTALAPYSAATGKSA